MSEKEKIKEIIRNNIQRKNLYEEYKGGQTCGMPKQWVCLYSEELDLKIEFGYHRSQIKNFEAANMLIELMIDEIIK